MKLVICTPTISRPHDAYLASLEASVPALDAAGFEHSTVFEIGCPYISHARASMLHKAMKHGADVVMFIDHDVSWDPDALLKVVTTPDHVVCATYRYKKEPEEYMGNWHCDESDRPLTRADGCIHANWVPAGFLKVTRAAIDSFAKYYPELSYGPERDHLDLFNHGAHRGIWFGEDYSFSRNWNEMRNSPGIWLVPDANVHHNASDRCYRGNLHEYLLRRPGGALHHPITEKSAA